MRSKPGEITRRELIRSDLSMLFRVGEDLPFWVPLNQIEVRSFLGSDPIIQVEVPEELEAAKKEVAVTEGGWRKDWSNVWFILQTIDKHEVKFSDPEQADGWLFYEWPKFRVDPAGYFAGCENVVGEAIWAAVEKKL